MVDFGPDYSNQSLLAPAGTAGFFYGALMSKELPPTATNGSQSLTDEQLQVAESLGALVASNRNLLSAKSETRRDSLVRSGRSSPPSQTK
jgi:hypothetical protein